MWEVFPASRSSFPSVCWQKRTPGKEPLLSGKRGMRRLQRKYCQTFSEFAMENSVVFEHFSSRCTYSVVFGNLRLCSGIFRKWPKTSWHTEQNNIALFNNTLLRIKQSRNGGPRGCPYYRVSYLTTFKYYLQVIKLLKTLEPKRKSMHMI